MPFPRWRRIKDIRITPHKGFSDLVGGGRAGRSPPASAFICFGLRTRHCHRCSRNWEHLGTISRGRTRGKGGCGVTAGAAGQDPLVQFADLTGTLDFSPNRFNFRKLEWQEEVQQPTSQFAGSDRAVGKRPRPITSRYGHLFAQLAPDLKFGSFGRFFDLALQLFYFCEAPGAIPIRDIRAA